MRTNIDIDDALMRKAMRAAGAHTKKATVKAALELLVRVRGQSAFLKSFGAGHIAENVRELAKARSAQSS
jgi:Arc/MetJ family transcription regulator